MSDSFMLKITPSDAPWPWCNKLTFIRAVFCCACGQAVAQGVRCKKDNAQ